MIIDDSTKLAFSIKQFCKAHAISRAKFYLLLNEGKAPRIMKVGRRTLISVEAASEWRKQMEQPSASLLNLSICECARASK